MLPFLDLLVGLRHSLYLRCWLLVVRRGCESGEWMSLRGTEVHIVVAKGRLHVAENILLESCTMVLKARHIVQDLPF